MSDTIKYYSFYKGIVHSPMESWVLEDLKLPAVDVKAAVILHYIHTQYLMKKNNKWLARQLHWQHPPYMMIKHSYRRVVEYNRVFRASFGNVISQFKKEKIYTEYQILEFFKNDPDQPLSS